MIEYIKRFFSNKKHKKLQKAAEEYKARTIRVNRKNRDDYDYDVDTSIMSVEDLHEWSPPTKTFNKNNDYYIPAKDYSIENSLTTQSHTSSSKHESYTPSYSSHSSYDSHSSSSYSDSGSSSSSDSGGGGGGGD